MKSEEVIKEKKEIKEEQNNTTKNQKLLMLYNDDYHTFDFVIKALIEICKHKPEQAEQCTYMVHYKGKCDVRKGKDSILAPMKDALIDRGLNATIE